MKRASILGCSACASADDALLLVWSASPNVIPTPRPDALIGPSVFVINTRQRGSALHLSEHAPAPALCSSHSPWNKSRGRRTRARNGMLKTDGSTRFLHLPHLSTSASQPSLVIPGSRWCGQHTLFGLGCVQDRIRATKTAFGLPPPTPSFLLTPDSRYHLGRTSGTMPPQPPSSPTLVSRPTASRGPRSTDRLVLSVRVLCYVVCLLAGISTGFPVSILPEAVSLLDPPNPCVNLF